MKKCYSLEMTLIEFPIEGIKDMSPEELKEKSKSWPTARCRTGVFLSDKKDVYEALKSIDHVVRE